MARRKSGRATERETFLGSKIWSEFQVARRWRLNLDSLWYVLYKQYEGRADIFFDGATRDRGPEIYEVSSSRDRAYRLRIANTMRHALDILTSKQMRVRPVPNTIPTSAEREDILSARASKDLLRHWWITQKFTSRRRKLFLDRNITGNAFMGVQFNALKGPYEDEPVMGECPRCLGSGRDHEEWETVPDPATGAMRRQPTSCIMCAGGGKILERMKRRPLGDVEFPVMRPWEIYPEPGATCIEDAPYIFRAYRLRPKQVKSRFPWMSDEEVKASAALEEADSYFARYARENRFEKPSEYAWIVEKHMPPVEKDDRPRMAILAGNRVVWPRPDDKEGMERGYVTRPERIGRIPIFHFQATPNPESFWAGGYAEDMVSSADTVNRGRDLQHRHMLQMTNPKWFVEMGSILDEALTTDVGEVVEYQPGSERPYSDRPAPLADMAERLIERENDRIYELAMVHELDRGIAPKNIEAAEALEILVEQSGQAIGPIVQQDNETFADLFFAGLCCAKANYQQGDNRFVLVGGEGSELEARALEGADVSTKLVVHVETGSAMHQNLALKRNHLLMLWDKGILKDPRELLQLMEFGAGATDYINDRRLQEATAYAENMAIEKGMQHVIYQGVHDHDLHASVHRRAALQAQTAGDHELAGKLTMAAQQHMQQMAPQPGPGQGAPGGGGGGAPAPQEQPPFDGMPPGGA